MAEGPLRPLVAGVPAALHDMLSDPDGTRAARVMAAMLTMKKLDVAALERAYRA